MQTEQKDLSIFRKLQLLTICRLSTFWQDFTIAEHYGRTSIRETFKLAFMCWKNNAEYFTELVMVLNWKIWQWHEIDESFARLYDSLWKKADQWAMENFTDEDLSYFLKAVD